uniref:Retrotransposon gag domain-containing protein n=1 Tax=Oryza brachyantha TaxID=4533 RepID=J3KUZ5_ORYBR
MAKVLMAVERNHEAQNAVLQQIAASAAATAAHIAQGAGGGGHQVAGGLAEFQRTQPPVFTRSDDPLDANDWLRTIERKLTLIRCPDAEKTNLAAEQLQGTAGNKSVMEYLREFNHLARYAPDDVNTDTRKENRFMNGLSPEMRLELAAHSFLVNRGVISHLKNSQD